MDNLTHTLIGIGIARTGLSQKFGRGTTVVLAVASNLPDVDVGCLFGGPLAFLWRRTATHCLLGATILVFLATAVFRRYYPNLSWPVVFGLTALGVAGHVFADLWNAWGVVLFWPFSWQRVSLNWVYIIDLFIWAILIVCWLLARGSRTARVWQVGLCLLAVYIGICAWCSMTTAKLVRERSHTTDRIYVYPEPLGLQRFRGVVQEPDEYTHYLAFPFKHQVELLGRIAPEIKTPVVEAVRQTEVARRLDWFYSTPVWRESADHNAAIVCGMEFRSAVLKHITPFTYHVTTQGQVSRERLVDSAAN